jgi:hypothetical protein
MAFWLLYYSCVSRHLLARYNYISDMWRYRIVFVAEDILCAVG